MIRRTIGVPFLTIHINANKKGASNLGAPSLLLKIVNVFQYKL